MNPERYKEGLFRRFDNQNISYNKLSKRQIRKYFKRDSLEDIEGVLITTIGKLYDGKNLNQAYDSFNNQVDKRKLFSLNMKLIAILITILILVKILLL